MMTLGAPYIENAGTRKRLCSKITFASEGNTWETVVWFEVDEEYAQYLCIGRQDAVLIAVLSYAMHNHHDIICEQVVSEELLYKVVQFYVPIIAKQLPEWNSAITIQASTTTDCLPNAKAVGAPVSCGVDSFYTIYENLNPIVPKMKLTHLVLLNAGGTGNSGDDKPRIWFHEKIEAIQPYVDSTGLAYVKMDTNLNEFYDAGEEGCHHSSACRITGCILALQHLFGIYHFPSGVTLDEFEFSADPHYFDLFNLHCFSNENLTFYSSGMQLKRIEKVAAICNYEPTYDYLNVCNHGFDNCSDCEKCVRTMMELFANDSLDLYKAVFNVEYFKKNYWKLVGRYVGDKEHAAFFEASNNILRSKGKQIPIKSYVYYYLYRKPYVCLRKGLKNNIFVRKIYERLGGLERFPPIR